MNMARVTELMERYSVPFTGGTVADCLLAAAKMARGYLMATDDSQPVDDDTLRADINEIETFLKESD